MSNTITKTEKLITPLTFREVTINLQESNHTLSFLSLENFRLSDKGELSKEEIISYKILLAQLAEKELDNFKSGKYHVDEELKDLLQKLVDGKRVKTKVSRKIQRSLNNMPATDYYKFKNAAQFRFGWALTVHKSMSYKWDEIFFNVETGGGKTNETYFKWIYTGMIRAISKVSLINYSPISPFDNTEFRDQNTGQRPLEIFFRSENPEPELRLNELRDLVTTKLSNYSVRNVEHYNWQERYFINNSENQEAIISFSYNGQGNFRLPNVMGGNAELAEKVVETLGQKSEINSFDAINDLWRKSEYEKLKVALSPFDIKFELILQSNWKDKIRFFSPEDELEIEMDYDGDGRVSFITAKYYNTETIWTNLKSAIIQIKES